MILIIIIEAWYQIGIPLVVHVIGYKFMNYLSLVLLIKIDEVGSDFMSQI